MNASNIPEDFGIVFGYYIADIDRAEKAIHSAVQEFKYRSEVTSRKTEFYYACAVEKAKSVTQSLSISDYIGSKRNTLEVVRDNIRDYPTSTYKEYVDLAKQLLEIGRQSEFAPIKKIDKINRGASTKWTKLNSVYAARTNHSTSLLASDTEKLRSLLGE